jgi:TMEM175 potassium channel family protein
MSDRMTPPVPQPGAPLHPVPPPPEAVAQRKRPPEVSPEIPDHLGPTRQEEEEERQYAVSRLVNFSDGVFAFAMTLLVVNLVPFAGFRAAPSPQEFFGQLLSAPFRNYLVSFVLSVVIIGHVWYLHHAFFRYIVTYNLRLFQLNLMVLMCVAFLPFPTDMLSRYGDAIVAAFYAGMLALLNVLMQLLWWYASSHHRLVRPTLEQDVITSLRMRLLLTLPLLLLSIGFAFVSLYLAIAAWVASLFVRPLVASKHSPLAKQGAGREEGER